MQLSDKGKIMKNLFALLSLLIFFLPALVQASPPVPFSGKVAINGVNFHGQAQFAFAIQDKNGAVHWRNGATANDAINVSVFNGRYVVLLGGQGMNPLPASLFANHDELYVRVSFDKGDGQVLVHLAPDQRITAVPYALSAEKAKMVEQGAITPQMIQASSITTAQLNEQILKYLKPEITLAPQAPGLIFGGQTITLNSHAEGKFLTYQWHKNGQPIAGATQDRYVIQSVNASQHEGNYTLVVTNDFGSVTTQATSLVVDGTPTNRSVELNATVAMDMLWVPAGTFTMGSPTTETGRQSDREDEHNVTLTKGFYLGKYEVTQAQYEAVMTGNTNGLSATPSEWPGNPNRPVEKVSWDDAQVFLTRLNAAEQAAGRLPAGWSYVLPTESQWEYACRAGTTTAYSWGETITSSNANYNWDGAHNTGSDFKQTRDVGQYAANPWGFFDMHGNVWEWTADRYQAAYPTGNPVVDPTGPASGSTRARRGGSWGDGGEPLRSARRFNGTPSYRRNSLGFRVGFQKQ